MKILSVLISLSALIIVSCSTPTTQEPQLSKIALINDIYYGEMRESMLSDYSRYFATAQKLVALNNNNPFFQYHLARANYLLDKNSVGFEAIKKHVSQINSLAYIKSDSLLLKVLNNTDLEKLCDLWTDFESSKSEEVAFLLLKKDLLLKV